MAPVPLAPREVIQFRTKIEAPATGLSQRAREVVEFPLGPVLLVAVSLLELAGELIALAADQRQVVVGELAPFFFDLSFQLFPIAFDLIPIHGQSPWMMGVLEPGASSERCRFHVQELRKRLNKC